MTYEADELRRSWKKCSCPIYASGTLGEAFKRKNTERPSWEDAKAVVRVWEVADAWDAPIPPAKPVPLVPEPDASVTGDTPGITIADATENFLSNRQNRGIEIPTLRKYRTFVKQFREYCDSRGYAYLQQLTVPDMDHFYAVMARRPPIKGQEVGPSERVHKILSQAQVAYRKHR